MSDDTTKWPKLVLLVENRLDLLATHTNLLEGHGYTVIAASTVSEAEELTRTRWVHLAIFDTRLVDDEDQLDFSGARLALREGMEVFSRLIYTSYREATAMDLLKRYFDVGTLPPGVLVRSKQELLSDIVNDAFSWKAGEGSFVGINFAQKIVYERGLSRFSMADWLTSEPLDDLTFLARAREIEDLLAKAFANFDRINLSLPRQGQSSSLTMIVTPEREGRPMAPFIVKCGNRTNIRKEFDNYNRYVYDAIPERAPHIDGKQIVETLHFGLIKYRIVGGQTDVRQITTFSDFYAEREVAAINQALTHLFGYTREGWYKFSESSVNNKMLARYQSRFYEDRLLFRSRGPSIDRARLWGEIGVAVQTLIASRPGSLKLERIDGTRLSWRLPTRELALPDPFHYLGTIRERATELFPKSYAASIGHGDLHAENIVVDDQCQTWLIDFEYTGWGPVLQDAVELESIIHFRLIPERQLERLIQLELALAEQKELTAQPLLPDSLQVPEVAELRKAFAVIVALRREVGQIPEARMSNYLLGLAYHALRVLLNQYPSMPDTHQYRPQQFRLHALFAASLWCKQLEELAAALDPPTPQPSGRKDQLDETIV